MKRRTFLIASATAAGGLVIGYRAWVDSFAAQAAALVETGGGRLLAGWVKIAPDDVVTVYVPHVDMGQGSQTGLAMMLAEELDAAWPNVRVAQAPAEKAFANAFLAKGWMMQGLAVPSMLDGAVSTVFAEAARFLNLQITGGSTAVRFTGQVGMRLVGAAARVMLIQAAAERWNVPASDLTTADSVVRHDASNRRARYGELAAEAAGMSVPARPPLKPPAQYKIVGTSVPRLDIPAKVNGTCGYGIDLRLPGMRYAAVRAAPVHGGRLVSVDVQPALAIAGVEKVVKLEQAIAVIAGGTWPAMRGLAALQPKFSDEGHGAVTTETIDRMQQQALERGHATPRVSIGDADAALAAAPRDRIVEAAYRVPYLHHAAIEPPSAVGQFKDGMLTVWSGAQNPLSAKQDVMRLADLDADLVTFIPMPMGGSFGRRGGAPTRDGAEGARAGDYFAQVVTLARELSPSPVKLTWDREEDLAQGAYRPQLATRLRGVLGADGTPAVWSQVFVDGAQARVESSHIPYAIPHQSIRSVTGASHVRTGFWRSVNHSQHVFWTESFIDELAHAAKRDPFEYRRALLPVDSRERRVLEAVADRAGWGAPLPAGVGRGIAVAESYGTVVAEVVEASMDPNGVPRVHRVVAVVECGGVCHPDGAAQQVEGAIVMGLSAAIAERITIERGAVAQKGFADYRLLTLAQTPPIDVAFLTSGHPWGGLGEPGVPPVAPALANALFAATGRRFRDLPIAAASGAAAAPAEDTSAA